MSWLLKLYPRAWRRRYGAEIEELVASQPRSLQLVVDLLGGAIDAHWNPQAFAQRLESATALQGGGSDMVTRLKGCGAEGPGRREALRVAALMIGGTLLLAAIHAGLRATVGSNPLVEGVGFTVFPGALVIGLEPLYLRGHSPVAKVALIGGTLLALFTIGVLASLA